MLTGWEDDVPVDDSLLRQFVLGNVARYRYLAGVLGTTDRPIEGGVLFDAGSRVVFDNALVLTRPPTDDIYPLIEEAKSTFDASTPWIVLSAWPLPDLSATGLQLMGHPPVMFRPAGPPGPSARLQVDGLEIVEIRAGDAAAMDAFAGTLEDAFPMEGARTSPWSSPAIPSATLRCFLGLRDGVPVATSAAFLDDGLVDVEMVSCRSSARGRGIGEAMTWQATLADPQAPAMLLASDDGQPLYRRMGYLRLLRVTLWFWPGAAGE